MSETQKQTNAPENKMGVMPVPKLLITMSLPMMLSMLVQALYNIVDSMFVAKLSEDALTAVSLAFPAQTLMISISSGTGVGINALLSRNLGEKDFEGANRAARNGVFLAIVSCIIFAIVGRFGAGLFFSLQTDNPAIIRYGTQYLRIITIMSAGIFLQITFERKDFLQHGHSGNRGNHQHHLRSDHDLRTLWFSADGSSGCRRCNYHRTSCSCMYVPLFSPDKE